MIWDPSICEGVDVSPVPDGREQVLKDAGSVKQHLLPENWIFGFGSAFFE